MFYNQSLTPLTESAYYSYLEQVRYQTNGRR